MEVGSGGGGVVVLIDGGGETDRDGVENDV